MEKTLKEKIVFEQLFLITTYRCNLNCIHCAFSSNSGCYKIVNDEVIFKAIDSADNIGFKTIDFSGGEPSIYTNFPYIVDYSLTKNFKTISIASNLSNIANNDYFKIFNQSQKNKERLYFRISIDGHTSSSHDRIRGLGTFEKLMNNINVLISHGIQPHTANTILHRENISFLQSIVKLIKQLGFSNHNWLSIFPFGRGKNIQNMQLTMEQWLNDLPIKSRNYKNKFGLDISLLGPVLSNGSIKNIKELNNLKIRPKTAIVITPNGDIFPECFKIFFRRKPYGNILKVPLRDVLLQIEALYLKLLKSCRFCDFRYICFGQSEKQD